MKKKHFYHHLLETSDISIEIAELDLTADERIHLISLVEANIHTSVVDTALSSLSEEDKKVFLHNLANDDHEKTWKHLKSKSQDIEEKLRKAIRETKKELLKDIKEVK